VKSGRPSIKTVPPARALPPKVFFKRYTLLQDLACRLVKGRKAAAGQVLVDFVQYALFCKSVFYSARFASAQAGVSRRTFWRVVRDLEALGLLRRHARARENGSRTSNWWDVSALVRALARLLNIAVQRLRDGLRPPQVEVRGGLVWVKAGGWVALDPGGG